MASRDILTATQTIVHFIVDFETAEAEVDYAAFPFHDGMPRKCIIALFTVAVCICTILRALITVQPKKIFHLERLFAIVVDALCSFPVPLQIINCLAVFTLGF